MAVNISVISLSSSTNNNANSFNLTGTPFFFSERDNRFTAIGCDSYAQQYDSSSPGSGCLSICACDPTQNGTYRCDWSCTILPNRKVVDANTSRNYSQTIPLQGCTSVAMVERYWLFKNYRTNPFILKDQEQVPVVLEWGNDKGSCYEEYNSRTEMCNKDNQCLTQIDSGHFCICDDSSSYASKDLCAGTHSSDEKLSNIFYYCFFFE